MQINTNFNLEKIVCDRLRSNRFANTADFRTSEYEKEFLNSLNEKQKTQYHCIITGKFYDQDFRDQEIVRATLKCIAEFCNPTKEIRFD